MAKNVLPVDFQDDILAESMNGRRKYQMITNSDGTVSFVDVTEYKQVGSNFGQAQVNATNEAVNESADKNKIIDDKDDLVANSQAGMMAGALAVKAIREELNQNMSFKPSMLSSAGIYFYVVTWSGNVIAGQTVNFGAANIPEGKSLIAMFLTPRATLHISMSYYNMSIYAYSETFTGEITYDVLMILNNS